MVRATFKVCRRQHVPLYSSKFSRKDFTLWQHIALHVLMQRVRKSYREFVDDFLTVTERLLDVLGLQKLPHFTTLEKFALRVSGVLLERVIGGFIHLTRIRSFWSSHPTHRASLSIMPRTTTLSGSRRTSSRR